MITSRNAAESIAAIYAAIAKITAGVYAVHPDVLIDLTFELWGHKHVIDYGLLRAADLDWLSNVGDNTDDAAGPRQARTLLYQRALAIPVEAMLIGNLQADTGDPVEKFATALGSCPLLLAICAACPRPRLRPTGAGSERSKRSAGTCLTAKASSRWAAGRRSVWSSGMASPG